MLSIYERENRHKSTLLKPIASERFGMRYGRAIKCPDSYFVQRFGTATLSKRCGLATTLDG